MARRFDEQKYCECGGRYRMSNKSKHLKSKKHQNYINQQSVQQVIQEPIQQAIQEIQIEPVLESTSDYELDINDLLTDYIEQPSDIYWVINYPQDEEEVDYSINNYRSIYSRIGKSDKKKWVNNIFYNYIKSHDDIIKILKQT